jgi:hypothetical protein
MPVSRSSQLATQEAEKGLLSRWAIFGLGDLDKKSETGC